jgi:transglutaminase-like putative cysteine protease
LRYRIERESRTRYESPVREHHVMLRVAPCSDAQQQVHACRLHAEPPTEQPASHRDGFGNLIHRFAIMAAHEYRTTRLDAEVETRLANPFDFVPLAPARERDWLRHSLREAPRLWDFLVSRGFLARTLPETLEAARVPVYDHAAPLFDQAQGAMTWVRSFCELDTASDEPCPELTTVIERRRGTAADLSHLLIALLRGWGVPARYAVGYIDSRYFERDEADPDADLGPRPQSRHAWAEILIPGAGWRGLDPAFGLLADDTYVRVAVGRDAGDVVSEREVFKGDARETETRITVQVTRLD